MQRRISDKPVGKFEEQMRDYVGSKHAVFVSSGSTANTILAMYLKDKRRAEEKANEQARKKRFR